ncbi:MAG TPA: hypothetical protein VJ873_05150 [bacterium]|nr:hypothetical protein [bacterium]
MKSRPFLAPGPWFCFLAFLSANFLLSYFNPPPLAWAGIFLLGIVLPFSLSLRSPSVLPGGALKKEFLPPLPTWAWGLLAALILALRFSQLTTLSVWPHYDEGMIGFYALGLSGPQSGSWFFGSSHAPVLYVGALRLLFRFFGSSLTTLWLLPAAVSALTVPLAYLAARQFLSRSLAQVVLLWAASGFWPLLLGRFSLMTGGVLLAEVMVLFLLGKFLQSPPGPAQQWTGAALGLMLGLGFFLHLHWPLVAAVVLATLCVTEMKAGSSWRKSVPFWLLPFLLLFLPFLYVFWTQGYGPYLLQLAALPSGNDWGERFSVSLSYLSALFWGMDRHFYTYQPVWGGLLNPVLGALFFMGLLEAWKRRKEGLHLWLLLSLAFFLLPAMATRDREPFRMVPLIPVLFALAGLGTASLSARLPKGRALAVVGGLFLLSTCLDAGHLFGAYHHLWDDPANWRGWAKSIERYRAYGILEPLQREKGPGFVFSDFTGGLPDQTLTVADLDFNAALNPRLSPSQANWAALLVNVNYRPFLKSRFPNGTAYALSKDLSLPDGGMMLFVFPLDENRRQALQGWWGAQKALEPFLGRYMEYSGGRSLEKELEILEKVEPAFQGDPFLQAVFFEKKSDMEARQSLMGFTDAGGDAAIQSLRQAASEGCPAAHLYERMGVLLLRKGRAREAKAAFEKARQAPLDLTDAPGYLQSPAPPLK